MPTGLIGKKLGMTQIYTEEGGIIPVTVIEAGPCTVTQVKTTEHDGYTAMQVGFGDKKASRTNKPAKGHLRGQGPFQLLREFRVDGESKLNVGDKLDVKLFKAGDLVDITGRSRGMGFQGGVKRYHFHGGPHTHGASDRERRPGSIGSTTQPGHVLKGLRMAGHMGDARVTTRNLKVIAVQPDKNLLLVLGAIPGARNSFVTLIPAKKFRVSAAASKPAEGKA